MSQPSDSLSTTTDVPLSGTGTSTPEPVAGNSDYSAWQWEAVLATVLSIPIPDRSEVTGQPWLTIGHDGQGGSGSHVIWTAGWNKSQNSGATSIEVYLHPDLYTAGGGWDRFANTPPEALSGVPSRQYVGLPLVPPSFEAASLVLGSATNFWESAAQQFAMMHTDASSGPIVGFQGNLASVAGELLGHLQTVTVLLHQQMTEPVRYSDSIEAAGVSAATFLVDVLSAHSSWIQLVEHSPLGAVVTVLEQIATPDPSGGYVIPDPQNTPFGDLTVDSSWVAVEQHAKDLWAGTLTGGTAGFTGLDLLGRTALSKLVNQFAATTSALVPVAGPAPPNTRPNPADPTPKPDGHGHNDVRIPPPSGKGPASPGSRPPPKLLITYSGPGGAGDVGGQFDAGGALGGPAPAPPGGNPNPVMFPAASLLTSRPLGSPAPARSTPAGGMGLGQPGFAGAIGRPPADGGNEGRRRKGTGGGRAGPGTKAVVAAPLTAPAAGFSIGRGAGGVVLQKAAVPTIAARPPVVTSSVINVRPVPVSGGTVPATAGPLAGAPPPASTHAPAEGVVVTGDGGMLGPGAPMGGAGTGRRPVERQRLAYLPQEPRYWGTEPDLVTSSLGTPADDDDRLTEQDFDAVPQRIAGIGARSETEHREEAATDWRML